MGLFRLDFSLGCGSSMPPGATNSEAENVFPAGACTESAHTPHIYVYA